MDPVAVSAVVSAVVSGAAGEAGGKLWDGLVALVRRPVRGGHGAGGGVAEVLAVQQARGDEGRVAELAGVLAGRAAADEDFAAGLGEWLGQAQLAADAAGGVLNVISGGHQGGPVFQGRDFRNLTFGSGPPAPPSE